MNKYYTFWLDFTSKMIRSRSFKLKQFCLRQISALINQAHLTRPSTVGYFIKNAGNNNVNGIYIVNMNFNNNSYSDTSNKVTYVKEADNENEQG